MSTAMLFEILQEIFYTISLLSAPLLGVSLVVGVMVSMLQAVTSIQEQTLVFVPKMASVMVTLFVLFPWMVKTIVHCTHMFFDYMIVISQ